MFSFIGGVLKWSALTLLILVLSHVIEIQGTTISQHVLKGMHAISGYSPKGQVDSIREEYSKAINRNAEAAAKVDPEISQADQKALNQVIQKAQRKK